VLVGDGLLVWSTGAVQLEGGSISLGIDGISLSGELSGRGVVSGQVNSIGGTTVPGGSIGRLEVEGNFIQDNASMLAVELGGTEPGTGYDQLTVNSNADLAGTLQVELVPEFTPVIGDAFDIVTAASVSESFSTEILPSMPGTRIMLLSSPMALTVVVTWPADADGDLDVDLDDYVEFLTCFLGPAGGLGSGCGYFDSDNDGDVDLNDFDDFQQVFTGG
jgi:hypothetical protein